MTLEMFRKDFKQLGYSEQFPKRNRQHEQLQHLKLDPSPPSKQLCGHDKVLPLGGKCVEFDLSRGREGNNPYPSPKIIIVGGCSASSAVSQMLKSILALQNVSNPGPCKFRNELLVPKKNPCSGTGKNMTGPILKKHRHSGNFWSEARL